MPQATLSGTGEDIGWLYVQEEQLCSSWVLLGAPTHLPQNSLEILALPSFFRRKKASCWKQQIYTYGNWKQEELKEWLLERLSEKCLSATSKIYPHRKGRNLSLCILSLQPRSHRKGLKKTNVLYVRYCLGGMAGSWRAEDRWRGQQHSAPLLPRVLTPNKRSETWPRLPWCSWQGGSQRGT